MSEELKPCPFCGGEADNNNKNIIYCHTCGAIVAFNMFNAGLIPDEIARKAWNRRADGWHDASEKPSEKDIYIVCYKGSVRETALWTGSAWFPGTNVTHWRPMPDLPEGVRE